MQGPSATAPPESGEDHAALCTAADEAVAGTKEDGALPADLLPQLYAVRGALEAIERKADAQAAELLKSIPHRSPFAEWRTFLRGLTSFYDGNDKDAKACWRTLSADRLPSQIVRRLEGLLPNPEGALPTPRTIRSWCEIDKAIGGKGVTAALSELWIFMSNLKTGDAFSKSQRLLRTILPPAVDVRRQLTELLYGLLTVEAAVSSRNQVNSKWVGKFQRLLEPLAIDPDWTLFAARVTKLSTRSVDELESSWRKAMDGIDRTGILTPEEKSIAKGLVLNHLAAAMVAKFKSAFVANLCRSAETGAAEWQARATRCLEESLALCPDLEETYAQFLKLLYETGRDAEAEDVARRGVDRFPNHMLARAILAGLSLRAGRFEEASENARRAIQLRPGDPLLLRLGWSCQLALAAWRTRQGQFDSARQGLAGARPWVLDVCDEAWLAACYRLVDAAEGVRSSTGTEGAFPAGLHPIVGALFLSMEAGRFGLDPRAVSQAAKELARLTKGKVESQAVGDLCQAMLRVSGPLDLHPGAVEHHRLVRGFLERMALKSLTHDSLLAAARYLRHWPAESFAILDRLVTSGCERFPNSAALWAAAATNEFDRPDNERDMGFIRDAFVRAYKILRDFPGQSDPVLSDQVRLWTRLLIRGPFPPLGTGLPRRIGRKPSGRRWLDVLTDSPERSLVLERMEVRNFSDLMMLSFSDMAESFHARMPSDLTDDEIEDLAHWDVADLVERNEEYDEDDEDDEEEYDEEYEEDDEEDEY